MDIKNILKEIFSLIQDDIKNNQINKIIEELLINELEPNMDYEIIVNNDIYNKLGINDPCINSFPENEKNFILEFQFIGNKKITYTIANFANKSNIELRSLIEKNDRFIEKSISLQIDKTNNHSELISQVVEKDNNDYYYDYNYNIYRYDSKYKKTNKNIEEDLDSNFHEIFHIPLENAYIYRNNFKMYSKYLNKEKTKYEMNEVDKQYTEDYYTFDGPYENIEQLKETLRENLLIDESIDNDKLDIYYDRIDYIINSLSNIINDNEFIMTINIYENIYRYVTNLSQDVLFTNGIIIQKDNNTYIMNNTHIEEKQLISIPKKISNSELYNIYKNTEIDEEDYDLEDFFGYNQEHGRYK